MLAEKEKPFKFEMLGGKEEKRLKKERKRESKPNRKYTNEGEDAKRGKGRKMG